MMTVMVVAPSITPTHAGRVTTIAGCAVELMICCVAAESETETAHLQLQRERHAIAKNGHSEPAFGRFVALTLTRAGSRHLDVGAFVRGELRNWLVTPCC